MIIKRSKQYLAFLLALFILYMAFPAVLSAQESINTHSQDGLLAYHTETNTLYAVDGTDFMKITVCDEANLEVSQRLHLNDFIQDAEVLNITDLVVDETTGKVAVAAEIDNSSEGRILLFDSQGNYRCMLSVDFQPAVLGFADNGSRLIASDYTTAAIFRRGENGIISYSQLPEADQKVLDTGRCSEKQILNLQNDITAVFSNGRICLYSAENLPEQQLTLISSRGIAGAYINELSETDLAEAAQLKKYFNDVLLVDAGNTLASQKEWSDTAIGIRLMNAAGYDVAAIGNSDYTAGKATLLENVQTADFPVLASNVQSDGQPLLETSKQNGQWTLLEKNGIRIGFFSISMPELSDETLTVTEPCETAQQMIDILKNRGASVIVCLSDTDTATVQELAQKFGSKGLNVILETGFSQEPWKVNGVLIQADESGFQKTDITLVDNRIVLTEASALTVDRIEKDETVLSLNEQLQKTSTLQSDAEAVASVQTESVNTETTDTENHSFYTSASVSENIGRMLTLPTERTNPLTGTPFVIGDYCIMGAVLTVSVLILICGYLLLGDRKNQIKENDRTAES